MTEPISNSLQSVNVLSVGGLTIDIVLKVDRLPGHDEKVLSSLVGRLPGGHQPNFACALLDSSMNTSLGFGQMYI